MGQSIKKKTSAPATPVETTRSNGLGGATRSGGLLNFI